MTKQNVLPEENDAPETIPDSVGPGDACFGPAFFLTQLGAFVRERCPMPAEVLPVVEVHLVTGDVLDVCHVIGLAPSWLALAVFDVRDAQGPPAMRTELLPYAAILRVTIRAAATGGKRVGFFAADRVPVVLKDGATSVLSTTPEELLARVAGQNAS